MDSLTTMKYKSIPLISNTHWVGFHDKKTTNLLNDKIRDNDKYTVSQYRVLYRKIYFGNNDMEAQKQGQRKY